MALPGSIVIFCDKRQCNWMFRSLMSSGSRRIKMVDVIWNVDDLQLNFRMKLRHKLHVAHGIWITVLHSLLSI